VRHAGIEFETRPIDDSPPCSQQDFFAGFLVGSVDDVEGYWKGAKSRRDGLCCPMIAICVGIGETQRMRLTDTGVVGLLDHVPTLNEIRCAVRHLAHRWETAESERPIVAMVQRPRPRKLTLLLADDNSSNRLLIGKILTQAGHSVDEAERGDQAFDML